VKKKNFERGANEHRGVKQNHPAESGFFNLCRAARDHLSLMASRDLQLHNAKQCHGHKKAEKRDDA
jgi:hypothetical protein